MNQANRIRALALAGGILWAGGANATSICELNLVPSPDFTNTGVCGQVITKLGGVEVQNTHESATVASASAQQGTIPPAAGSDGTSGTATANYPNSNGIGGSVGASAFASGGGGTSGLISTESSSFYIGEFIADDGLLGSSDLTVNLGITGALFVEADALASLIIAFAAVDADGKTLGDFTALYVLTNAFGLFPFFPFTDPDAFMLSGSCLSQCTATVNTTESFTLAGLIDGDVFGLFLSIVAIATVQGGADGNAAYADFANTIDISFTGGNVTALPSTITAPEPASVALVLVGVLVIALARTRRSA